MISYNRAFLVCLAGTLPLGCVVGTFEPISDKDVVNASNTGGATSSGMTSSASDSSMVGGNASNTGGTSNSTQGGVANVGGGSNGASTQGGAANVGGAPAGGSSASGSNTFVAGAANLGGNTASGGTSATGGTAALGGNSAVLSSTGGLVNTGGTFPGTVLPTGGVAATGGYNAGGGTTGGAATGGVATGGVATGGVATGGVATGGVATGGAATGGVATGGVATGGVATGGTTTGGSTCSAPASASAIQFVDPAAGTDDPVHGSAFGACAYKSLTYALTRATGQIALQSATYTSTTETFPIVLTENQQLLCKYTTAASAVIQGEGLDGTGKATTIAFTGWSNALDNCKVDGNGGSGYCVHITSSGSFSSSPHVIKSSDIGNCGSAGITIRYADYVTVSSSSIHNNQVGVSWLGPNTGGSMLNNTFRSNAINDIDCSIADSGVTGSGNTALGGLYCSTCGNCPF